jgi:hypothetical protein
MKHQLPELWLEGEDDVRSSDNRRHAFTRLHTLEEHVYLSLS